MAGLGLMLAWQRRLGIAARAGLHGALEFQRRPAPVGACGLALQGAVLRRFPWDVSVLECSLPRIVAFVGRLGGQRGLA